MSVTGPRLQPTLFERSAPGRGGGKIPHPPKDALDRLPAGARRATPPALPELKARRTVLTHLGTAMLANLGALDVEVAEDGQTIML